MHPQNQWHDQNLRTPSLHQRHDHSTIPGVKMVGDAFVNAFTKPNKSHKKWNPYRIVEDSLNFSTSHLQSIFPTLEKSSEMKLLVF